MGGLTLVIITPLSVIDSLGRYDSVGLSLVKSELASKPYLLVDDESCSLAPN